jgi:hypothetical protein
MDECREAPDSRADPAVCGLSFCLLARVLLALVPLTACSTAPPKLKQGLWEIHGQSLEKPSGTKAEFTYQLCRDHAFDTAQEAQLKSVTGCKTQLAKQGEGKLTSASNCKVGGTLIGSNGVTVFKSATELHSDTHATYAPPLLGKAEETMTEDQRYLGACPAGMRPGDTLGQDGIVRHHD